MGGKILSAAILMTGILMVMATERTNFTPLLLAYSAAFIMYHLVIRDKDPKNLLLFWIPAGILFRVVTLFFFPNLSDDIYRFIWDGALSADGLNPYMYTPSMVLGTGSPPALNTPQLFRLLNSPEYFTIYPPFCQFLFWVGAILFKGHWFAQAMFLKGTILLAETGSILLIYRILKKLNKPVHWVLIYALNPLVIIELTGNAHFEGWMVFFMLASLYAYLVGKPFGGGFFLGLGILSKLIPALIVPPLIRRLSRRGILISLLGAGAILFLGFLPFMQASMTDTAGKSLGLYFQKFEFNASIYYALRWFIGLFAGFNPIQILGPSLAAIFIGIAVWIFVKEKEPRWQNLPELIVILLSSYFFLSTTVHPWYICTIIAFAALTNIRYPMIWSYLIFTTYISYQTPAYTENIWMVFWEYALLTVFIVFEIRSGRTGLSRFLQGWDKKRALSK